MSASSTSTRITSPVLMWIEVRCQGLKDIAPQLAVPWLHGLFVYLLFLILNIFKHFLNGGVPCENSLFYDRVEALDLILEKMKADNFPFDKATACGFASRSLVRST